SPGAAPRRTARRPSPRGSGLSLASRRPRRVQAVVAARRETLELGLHQRVEVAIENGAGVGRLVVRPQVLDHLVRVQDVAPDLVAPAGLDVLALQLADRGLLLLERALEEAGLEDLDRHLAVLRLRPLVLALGDDAGGKVRQP